VVVVLLVSGVASAQTSAAVVAELRRLAEQGDVLAQYNLGIVYDTGKGVPQDYTEAVRWYRLAAEQGHASAQYNRVHYYRAHS
jgi:TPR repeat protein